MRILLVEDDATYVAILQERLERIPSVTLQIAQSRDAATAQLTRADFDLIVCDLRIPTTDGQLDLEIEHGISVLAAARNRQPGTPIIILSAFGTIDFAVAEVREAARVDIIGDGNELSMVDYKTKDQIYRCVAEIEELAARFSQTGSIEIRRGGAGGDLATAEARLIKVYARTFDGRVVQVDRVHGGLSDTTTLRLRVTGSQGQLRASAFAKLGPLDVVADEAHRFEHSIVPMLRAGSFATLQRHLKGGAGTRGAIFYQLAGVLPSLFDMIGEHQEKGPGVIDRLSHNTHPWLEGAPHQEMTIHDMRILIGLDDLSLPLIDGINCESIERLTAVAARAVQHGDLHGENVLINSEEQPLLIDFGRVGESIAGYDPVTLELSLLFHPAGCAIRGPWPSLEQVEHWDDLDTYVDGCPLGDFVRACRRWAFEASPSDGAVWACVYLNAMRQLQYDDTDKELVYGVMRSVSRVLLS